MIPLNGRLILNLLLLLASLTSASTNYENYLLSCGGSSASVSTPSKWDQRVWRSDDSSTLSAKLESTISATVATTSPGIPFTTARIFKSSITYSFQVSPGPKFIRLYFNPSPSPYISDSPSLTLYARDAYVTVKSSTGHLLLSNFSAYSVNCNNPDYFFKEFLVDVGESHLNLTFIPESIHAFINGIEVVSVPKNLYYNSKRPPAAVDQENIEFTLANSTALETSYRLNVGGNEVSSGDSGNMHRTWGTDESFLIGTFKGQKGFADNTSLIKYTVTTPNYTAPAAVYETMRWMGPYLNFDKMKTVNVTWSFKIDLGFRYLVRLHWCETSPEVKSSNYRVFVVYINQQIVEKQADIYLWAGGIYTPIYRDYVVIMAAGESNSLQLAMHINTDYEHEHNDILLNGLEIFKISGSDGSLNGATINCSPITTPTINEPPSKPAFHILPVIIGVITGAILLAVLFCWFLIFRSRKYSKTSGVSGTTSSSKSKYFFSSSKPGTANKSGGGSSYLPSHLCRHFTLMDIRHATSDFSDSLIVGHGGFGNVYKGTVDTEAGPTLVAIKRLKALSNQGAREFAMEIQLLSKLRHVNLVSLIGYCDEAGEMILVYEYMSHGTLKDHLYPNNTQLSWRERLEVCVGAARGLNYLHTGTDRMVIHRDVKSANILLDEAWMAKVADFGLSKLGPTGDDLSHVSTAVKGSFGYVDPEYYRRQQLTEKSDVYSFGVVLFEVLCGRAAVNPNLPKEQVNLRMWARRNQLCGTLDAIVDPKLVGQIAPESLRKYGEVAESCVRDEGTKRPSMADVIGGLELALKLQMEDTVSTGLACPGDEKGSKYPGYTSLDITSPTTDESDRLIRNMNSGESTWTSMNNSTSGLFSSSASQGYGGSGPVFSEIFKPEGR